MPGNSSGTSIPYTWDNARGYITTSLYNSPRTIGYYRPHSQSAFADAEAASKRKANAQYDIERFFEKNLKRSSSPVFAN